MIITGAGSGVGRASALRFAEEGARVLVADVVDDWAAETVRLVNEAGGTAIAQHCDVTVEADVAATVDAAVARLRPPRHHVQQRRRDRHEARVRRSRTPPRTTSSA